MNIALRPLQQVDEANVLNGFFALNLNSGDEGCFVTIQSSGWVNNANDMYRFINLTTEPNAVSQYRALTAQVGLSASGEVKGKVLGIMLKNVRQYDYLGRDLRYDDVRKTELNAVVSGESIPICKRGLFLVSGVIGTPAPGSGIAVANVGSGLWRAYDPAGVTESGTKSLGHFLGKNDRNGYALAWIDC